MSGVIIRIMGESDVVDVTMQPVGVPPKASPLLRGKDAGDRMNLLGHWLDQGRGTTCAEDPTCLEAMTIIASEFMATNPLSKDCQNGTTFILLTILREKWPVGLKAKFRVLANRVGANHTYLAHPCGANKLKNLSDEDSLKRSEADQLALALPFYRVNRKRFANSSAVQRLIKEA